MTDFCQNRCVIVLCSDGDKVRLRLHAQYVALTRFTESALTLVSSSCYRIEDRSESKQHSWQSPLNRTNGPVGVQKLLTFWTKTRCVIALIPSFELKIRNHRQTLTWRAYILLRSLMHHVYLRVCVSITCTSKISRWTARLQTSPILVPLKRPPNFWTASCISLRNLPPCK